MPARVLRAVLSCLLVAAAPAASAMSFAALQQLIVDRNVHSIDDLLPLLPTDLRSRYVLMFHSRSLHGSSFAHPRAILFDPEARLVVSFNGDPGQAGFEALETMEFDDADKSFKFREIIFPGAGLSAEALPAEARSAQAGSAKAEVRFSQPNPELCRKCHGDPARPIWDTHPSWPGAYGERYEGGLAPLERSGLREFLREQPTHPRYRYLLEIDRFANLETFRPSARTRYEGNERAPPNAELGAALGRLNFQSIVHLLESRPQFDSAKYVLLATLGTDCGPLDAFFPEAEHAAIDSALDRFVDNSARANAAQLQQKQLRAVGADRSGPGGYAQAASIESLDRFRFVVETLLGLSTSQWTTALEKGSYDFNWSPSATTEMAAYLRQRMARSDQQINGLADFRTFSERDPYCTYLSHSSREALAAVHPVLATGASSVAAAAAGAAAPAPDRDRTQALLDQCAGCHLTGVGPHLPFDRPHELAALLSGGHFAHGTLMDEIQWRLAPQAGAGRMPLGSNLSDDDRDALLNYFARILQQAAAR